VILREASNIYKKEKGGKRKIFGFKGEVVLELAE